jgi:hypothetical protein
MELGGEVCSGLIPHVATHCSRPFGRYTAPGNRRAVTREIKDICFSMAQTEPNCLTESSCTIYESLEVSGVTGQKGDIISIL